jgi:NhaA family Na+:H+ antiporter
VPRVVVQPLQRFLDTEVAGGVVLLAAAVVAIAWANSPWAESYVRLWHTDLSVTVGDLALHGDLQHWINDLAMALFFFVAGLEIKRELVHGDLRSPRTAAVPIACAVGGMAVPAIIFWSFNRGTAFVGGWGIPMATDIAFAVGVLALVGRRAPASLRVFLLTLAIVDDIGAIVVIAVFYSSGVSFGWLALAVLVVVVIAVLARLQVRSLVPYAVLGAALWLAVYDSGVHATIAGVVLGLLTPAHPFHRPRDVQRAVAEPLADPALVDDVTDEADQAAFLEVADLSREAVSPLARLERALHPWSAYVVLPLFALANAGIVLDRTVLSDATSSTVTHGVVWGLVVGKPLGILLAGFVVIRFAGGRLPSGAGWLQFAGVGALAGIGFTVSLFITGLAFAGPERELAKIGILAASLIAGVVGAGLLVARPAPERAASAP